MFRKISLAGIALLFALTGCTVHFQSPVQMVTPGPDVTDTIKIPVPDAQDPAELKLVFGAGKMTLAPGAEDLVNGTATYNIPEFKPEVREENGTITLQQGDNNVSVPNMNDVKNEWDLKLGSTPVDLTINAGAYEGDFELGGLALSGLTVQDGAADVRLNFSEPNKTKMGVLRYETGASNVNIKGIANSHATSVIFKSGAGNYTLDFSGELVNDMSVTVESGMSYMTLIIPNGMAAEVTVDSGLSNVNFGAGWEHHGDTYTRRGDGPKLVIVVKMGAGNLDLQNQ
jgi:hypothetical protein